jgi:hypothetical protein
MQGASSSTASGVALEQAPRADAPRREKPEPIARSAPAIATESAPWSALWRPLTDSPPAPPELTPPESAQHAIGADFAARSEPATAYGQLRRDGGPIKFTRSARRR